MSDSLRDVIYDAMGRPGDWEQGVIQPSQFELDNHSHWRAIAGDVARAITEAGWRPPLPDAGDRLNDLLGIDDVEKIYTEDGWYPAAMREHDRANAAELDRTAAARRAASWWEAAKTLNRWGTAHREAHRAALVEITNLTAVRDELAHQRNDHRARADAAEAKLAVFMAANIETFRALDAALAEGGEARAKLDQVRAEIRAVLDEFMGSDVAEALVWNREIPAVEKLAFSLRAIVERESATRCVNDTNGDGDCAACAHNPNAPCRSASEEPTCACDRPVARCSCRIADLCKAAADKLDTEETTP